MVGERSVRRQQVPGVSFSLQPPLTQWDWGTAESARVPSEYKEGVLLPNPLVLPAELSHPFGLVSGVVQNEPFCR